MEMVHTWCEATDKPDTFVRVLLVDYSKAFDHINHETPCPMFKYVDDSTVFDVCNNSSVPMLQESADIITDWSRNNDMRINATKTKEMVICFCASHPSQSTRRYIIF